MINPPKSSKPFDYCRNWLETQYCAPSFGGCVLGGIALAFFGAGVNTMSGWLYVLSGMISSLLIIAAYLCWRSLRGLNITRLPIQAVTVGQQLTLELIIDNSTSETKQLFQVRDLLPLALTETESYNVSAILPQSQHRQVYHALTQRRGIYRWEEILLRSGNPLGLFWCRRVHRVPARAIVYPLILPLNHCPLIDLLGEDNSVLNESDRRYLSSQEGITKAIRPYRLGDPTRLIHWRTTARFGEFKVRELEIVTGGENLIIALDTSCHWQSVDFELAVTATASICAYASRCQLNVQLWTNATGLVNGKERVLEALAMVEAEDTQVTLPSVSTPVVWLTQNTQSIQALSPQSRWIFFACDRPVSQLPGIVIRATNQTELQQQLQQLNPS
ncbi:DUF58 domain-containing protein [Gloeocapsa sp. PCC 73106]|uniref:DUF58 domain-containing protein n=1 Tax=Gloeocapsa sp. PCC 73106 TaxID=102232 RepID=UPI0002ABE72C|nr:DUF58 domain-containing protein [Gloeocapsa sp. PCC 73106]ELR99211.1 hypothetical protein GLO73106DRAFT_00030610 [Gloeocapsa sp. PCC 73106]